MRRWRAGALLHLFAPSYPRRRVLNNPGAARAWAQSWRACPWTDAILWEKRESKRRMLGRFRSARFGRPRRNARCANRSEQWNTLVLRSSSWPIDGRIDGPRCARMRRPMCWLLRFNRALGSVASPRSAVVHSSGRSRLARRTPRCKPPTFASCRSGALRHEMDGAPPRCCRSLHRAMIRTQSMFCKQSTQFRMRALDVRLALGGLTEVSVSAAQLDRCTHRPDVVIVCENLVNVLAMPSIEGAFAIHGSGYAVKDFREVSWFASTPILYWGDLDNNGFAILNQFRCYFDHVNSVMMDEATLDRHYDLCVEEPKPNTGTLSYLKESEQAALARLLAGVQIKASAPSASNRSGSNGLGLATNCKNIYCHSIPSSDNRTGISKRRARSIAEGRHLWQIHSRNDQYRLQGHSRRDEAEKLAQVSLRIRQWNRRYARFWNRRQRPSCGTRRPPACCRESERTD